MSLRSLALSFALCGAVLLSSMPAVALSVTPIQVEMLSTGGQRAQVTVNNDSQEPLPVEIGIDKLALDENGGRKLSKAGEDFLVFPAQAMIAPGSSQVFRLQWVGDPMIAESQTFMMSINQVPVKLPKGKSAVQIVMSFGVVVNVAPPQGSPQLTLVGTGIETDKKTGKRHPTITVANPTKIHALLPQGAISLSGGSWSKQMTAAELSEKVGIGLVQPGKKRKFVLPVDLPADVASVRASLDFKPKR